jgi:hypothetical protein
VTSSTGYPVQPGQEWSETVAAGVLVHGIVASGTCAVRYQELAT